MYSSIPEAEYQFRRAKAEEEARNAYDQSNSAGAEPALSGGLLSSFGSGRISSLLSRIEGDDLLLIGLLFLLFNENKDDDPLILLILAVLLFT